MYRSTVVRQVLWVVAGVFLSVVTAGAQCDQKWEGTQELSSALCPNPIRTARMPVAALSFCLDGSWKTGEAGSSELTFTANNHCTSEEQGQEPLCTAIMTLLYWGIENDNHKWRVTWYDAVGLDELGNCVRSGPSEAVIAGVYAPGCCSSVCSSQDAQDACEALDRQYQALGCVCQICKRDGALCASDYECCSYVCGDDVRTCGIPTPIVIDLGRPGRSFDLTSAEAGVRFDIDADGDADRVAWTGGDRLVGFLALDRNKNGMIDNGAELFGNATPLSTGQKARSGFDALVELDSTSGNADGIIDAQDGFYGRLIFWVDRNHDGVSQPSELQSLTSVGVTQLLTRYRESRRTDRYGNVFRYVGRAMVRRHGAPVPVPMVDVILRAAAPGSLAPSYPTRTGCKDEGLRK